MDSPDLDNTIDVVFRADPCDASFLQIFVYGRVPLAATAIRSSIARCVAARTAVAPRGGATGVTSVCGAEAALNTVSRAAAMRARPLSLPGGCGSCSSCCANARSADGAAV